jgi:hypothetical protein
MYCYKAWERLEQMHKVYEDERINECDSTIYDTLDSMRKGGLIKL